MFKPSIKDTIVGMEMIISKTVNFIFCSSLIFMEFVDTANLNQRITNRMKQLNNQQLNSQTKHCPCKIKLYLLQIIFILLHVRKFHVEIGYEIHA